MSSDLNIIPGLSGEEAIQDICAALAEKLRGDCNLREIDQYAGGYEASLKIGVKLFGLDTATADYELEIKNTTATLPADTIPDVVIDTELEIPLETDLGLVRERSNQPTPDFEIKPTVEITPDGPVTQPQPRRYTRRVKALAQATGGAAGPLEE